MSLFRRRRTTRSESPAPRAPGGVTSTRANGAAPNPAAPNPAAPNPAGPNPRGPNAAGANTPAGERETQEATARPGRQRRPDVGLLRRERRALLAVRDSRMRDLGGLTVEMYRYGAWRSDLLQERCAELTGIESRLADIDALLGDGPPARRCLCGAVLREGAQFCSNCGRIVADGAAAPVAAPPGTRGR